MKPVESRHLGDSGYGRIILRRILNKYVVSTGEG
jgi:hypothetical protein